MDSLDIRSCDNKEESEEISAQSGSPLREYVRSSGSLCQIVLAILLLLLCQTLCSGADYWVTFWTQQEERRNSTFVEDDLFDTNVAIYIYTAIIVAVLVVTLTRSLFYFKLAMNASKNLHNRMFAALLEAPMKFFHTNPCGRILNRFSKDMGAIDEVLPKVLLEALQVRILC